MTPECGCRRALLGYPMPIPAGHPAPTALPTPQLCELCELPAQLCLVSGSLQQLLWHWGRLCWAHSRGRQQLLSLISMAGASASCEPCQRPCEKNPVFPWDEQQLGFVSAQWLGCLGPAVGVPHSLTG